MLLTRLAVCIGLATLLFAAPLRAAEIKVVNDPLCKISLDGEIKSDDAAALKASIKKAVGTLDAGFDATLAPLCLNSPGGSYPEALKIIDLMIETAKVPTVIKASSQCYSACALIFLAGSYWPDGAEGQKELNKSRTLYPGGKLGFHAPYSDLGDKAASPETIKLAIKVGAKSITSIMARNEFGLFPESLLLKALVVDENDTFDITTVEEATRWDIEIPQQIRIQTIDKAAAMKMCGNAFTVRKMRFDELESIKRGKDEDGEKVTVVYGNADGLATCEITYSGPPGDRTIYIKLDDLYLFGSNWLFLLDRNTRIDSLRLGTKAVAADAPPAGKKGTPQIFRNYDFSGPDIDTVDAASSDACAKRCAETVACMVFSYNRWAKKCFLKSGFASARFEPRSVSGSLAASYKPGRKPDTVQNFRGRKFKDKSSGANAASSFDDCLAACLKDSGCIAINFQKSKRQCQFFSSVNEYFPDAEYDAAMRWEAP